MSAENKKKKKLRLDEVEKASYDIDGRDHPDDD